MKTRYKINTLISLCLMALSTLAHAADPKLTGTPIGSSPSVDYGQNGYPATTTVNTPQDAFDGNFNTFFASYARNNTWVGLDLGEPCIITSIGWAPRNDGNGPGRLLFGRFEGANNADFSDAYPLYIIGSQGIIGQMTYANIQVSKGFRYVRYCGPANSRCNIAEIAFHGKKGVGNLSSMYIGGGLPIVYINTDSGVDPYDKIHEQTSIVTIVDEKGNVLTDSATVRLRGNKSAEFEKKPYRIKFKSKHHVLGSPAKAKKWTLINNYGDKTLMRNMIAFRTSELLGMPYTPFCQPVNVYVNGDYKGCYQLCDQVEVHKDRVDINELTTNDNNGYALQGGYFVEIDAYADQEPAGGWFTAQHNIPVTFKSPSDSITMEQRNYITTLFNRMVQTVYSENNWRSYLDDDTFIRHFLVGEFSGNTDTYWSVYMYKKRDDIRFYTGPVWDFDLAFENDNRTYRINNLSDFVYYTKGSIAGDMRSFVSHITRYDQQTKDDMTRIWSIARDNGLTEEYMLHYVDSVAEVLEEAQKLNFTRWNILTQWVHMNPQVAGSYQGEVNVVKNYITQRFRWMDNKIGYRPHFYSSIEDNSAEIANGLISIWNVQGVLLYQGEEMPSLPQGVYIIKQGTNTHKLIIP